MMLKSYFLYYSGTWSWTLNCSSCGINIQDMTFVLARQASVIKGGANN